MPYRPALGSPVASAAQASTCAAEIRDLSELLARSRDEQLAREMLVVALYPHLRRFMAHRFPAADPDQRQDFVHEAVLRVISHLDACRARDWSGFRAWAFATARRVALSHYRLAASAGLVDWDVAEDSAEHSRGDDTDSVTHVHTCGCSGHIVATYAAGCGVARSVAPDAARDVAGRLMCDAGRDAATDATLGVTGDDAADPMGARLARIAAAAQTVLPDRTQELIYLRIVEHRSWSEIAGTLRIPASAAKRRFQRAQGRLREELIQRIGAAPEPFRTEAVIWLSARCRRHHVALRRTPVSDTRRLSDRHGHTSHAEGR